MTFCYSWLFLYNRAVGSGLRRYNSTNTRYVIIPAVLTLDTEKWIVINMARSWFFGFFFFYSFIGCIYFHFFEAHLFIPAKNSEMFNNI